MSLYEDLPPESDATAPRSVTTSPALRPMTAAALSSSSAAASADSTAASASSKVPLSAPSGALAQLQAHIAAQKAAQAKAAEAIKQAQLKKQLYLQQQKLQQQKLNQQQQQQQQQTTAKPATTATPSSQPLPFFLNGATPTASPLTAATPASSPLSTAASTTATAATTTAVAAPTAPSSSSALDVIGSALELQTAIGPNEYDPRIPNEYEQYVKVRDAKRREEKERRMRREREEKEREMEMDDEEWNGSRSRIDPATASPAARPTAPPSSFTHAQSGPAGVKLDLKVSSGEEAYLRRQQMSQAMMAGRAGGGAGGGGGGGGENESNKRARIDSTQPLPSSAVLSTATSTAPPSRVLLLLNMVGRGEADLELEGETAEECSKFGRVTKCSIFEVPDMRRADGSQLTPDSEAVRIFVAFDEVESSVRAQRELNGRFFAGRRVQAMFFDENRFVRGQLAP